MPTRECDCKEFQDTGHTDECNEHYKPKPTPAQKALIEQIVAENIRALESRLRGDSVSKSTRE